MGNKGGCIMDKNKFIFMATNDDTTDDYYEFTGDKNLHIQIVDYSTPTMYVVNKWNESEQSMTQYEFYSLNKAKDKVLELV
jgi:predicted GTPase